MSSSEEDRPLSSLKNPTKAEPESSDDEDTPLTALKSKKRSTNGNAVKNELSDSDEDKPLASMKKEKKAKKPKVKLEDSSDEDMPLAAMKKSGKSSKKRKADSKANVKGGKRVKKEEKIVPDPPEYKWWREENKLPEGVKWKTLEHHGVLFPPEYEPHGVKMLYDGKPVTLTAAQEEIATFYAVMLETDYVKTNPTFNKNFFRDWKKSLGKGHVIEKLDKCDFRPIYDHCMKVREEKKKATPEEKKKAKEEKQAIDEKFGTAMVDSHPQKVGNFRVEPPGLFRGRGEHPKAGTVKTRVYPEDVTINIGKGVKPPPCPIPGRKWGGVVHNNKVTWLAYWKDPVNDDFKYVWLAANSRFRGESDLNKFEKARKLKKHVKKIREAYHKDLNSKEIRVRQMATCLYFIDKLALRVGNEKDEDNEADTVGCCSLRKEHITLEDKVEDGEKKFYVTFDFLGKDSIQYLNTVEVLEVVHKNLTSFTKGKKSGDELFDQVTTSNLNTSLKDYMDGLTAKVFRTFNASITLDIELQKTPEKATIQDKIVYYNKANREVAILCNHQKAVPKGHTAAMEKLDDKMAALLEEKKMLKKAMENVKAGKAPPKWKDKEGKEKKLPEKEDKIKNAQDRLKTRIDNLKMQQTNKEMNKTVALNTSKINYNDPRITIAWCRKHQVPLVKVFNKSLVEKFPWALDVDADWRF